MAWQVELDWDWKVYARRESKQNLDDLYYGALRELCGRIGKDNAKSALSIPLLK